VSCGTRTKVKNYCTGHSDTVDDRMNDRQTVIDLFHVKDKSLQEMMAFREVLLRDIVETITYIDQNKTMLAEDVMKHKQTKCRV